MNINSTNTQLTVKYVDWIISQVQNSTAAANITGEQQQQKQLIKSLELLLLQKQKETRIFSLTVDALQRYCQSLYQHQYQVIEQVEIELEDLKRRTKRGSYQQQFEEQELRQLEKRLQEMRDYAEQRREKKAKREKQYHEVYHLPIINAQFKKKYMRAREKNNAVEHQLAELHYQMDHIKEKLRQYRAKEKEEQDYYQKKWDQHQIFIKQWDQQQKMMLDMKKAQRFWTEFDTLHLQPCLKWAQQQNNNNEYHRRYSLPSSTATISFNDWYSFRAAIKKYEEANIYGMNKWNHEQWLENITFDCSLCHESITGLWPYLDKVRTDQLLCTSCYHNNKTSMIVEKKLQTFLPNKLTASRPNLLRSATQSTLSIPTLVSSTSKSTQSLLQDCKPLMKKMKSALALNQQKSDMLPHLLVSR
ncbi:hypothetical protein BJ944DRAFT_10074 [Cunninghamella echinulata]|nr:hypothetical protein BJ944DRAFT_10074 [Cunninghamella echinulata]